MPRTARFKNCEAIYHIMCRSISEILLFRDNSDKEYYLRLLKRYKDKFKCRIYSYCLMDNHLHMQLDTQGFDVSKFMHCVNTAFVRYYNTKYERHGHLFQDRFKSKILNSDQYLLAASAYIHNNPKDIGYEGKEELYQYSSYGIYLGIRQDSLDLIHPDFIMSIFDEQDINSFSKRYYEFVSHQRDVGSPIDLRATLDAPSENTYVSGRNVIIRDIPASKIISYISDWFMAHNPAGIITKSKRNLINLRATTAYCLRVLGDYTYKSICNNMHNMTVSGCSRLCDKGYSLFSKEPLYGQLFEQLIELAA